MGVEVRTYEEICITRKSSKPDIDYSKFEDGCFGNMKRS